MLCFAVQQHSRCCRKYSRRFEKICHGYCACHLWHSCSDRDAVIVYLQPWNSEIALRFDWKRMERNSSHLLNTHPPTPPTHRPFNNCSHWLQKLLPRHHYMYRNSKSITSSYNKQDRSSVSTTVTKHEDWAIWDSVFDSRQKKKCFSSAHRRKWFWGPSSLLPNVGGGLHTRGQRGREMKRNPRLRRMTRLRMRACSYNFISLKSFKTRWLIKHMSRINNFCGGKAATM
jgi:hypothetical protein